MGQRLDLQSLLESLLGTDEVYFQPPPTVELTYPVILYVWDDEATEHADNLPYHRRRRYQVTVIDRDPDSVIPDKIGALPLCTFDRFYTADNLNHYVYKLYF